MAGIFNALDCITTLACIPDCCFSAELNTSSSQTFFLPSVSGERWTVTVVFLGMSSASLLYTCPVVKFEIRRSKSVSFPSLFCRTIERFKSLTEMLRPSQGTEWKSRSFLNLNLTDITAAAAKMTWKLG